MTYHLDLGIKRAVKEWMNNRYQAWVKQPIETKTLELENFITQQVKKANQYNPLNQYQQQPIFYRGLFWITLALLVVVWLVSG